MEASWRNSALGFACQSTYRYGVRTQWRHHGGIQPSHTPISTHVLPKDLLFSGGELSGGIMEEFGSQSVISGSISVPIQGRNIDSQAYDDHSSPTRFCRHGSSVSCY